MPFASPRLAAPRPAAADRGAFDPESTEPLTLPPAWTPPARPPLPVVAAIVPIVGAIGLWLVTGSILSLWLAALGPLIAVATLADAARSTRRDRRRHLVDADRAHTEVAQTVARRHDHERRLAWARHPDVTSLLDRDEEIWRRSPGRGDLLVIGEGEMASAVRITGGDGDARAVSLRARSSRLSHAPVTAPAETGIVVVGDAVVAGAVQRALVIQLCLALPPGELTVLGPLTDELAWMRSLPHRTVGAPRRLAAVGPGVTVPSEADIVIAHCAPGDPHPPRCGTIITVRAPDSATAERGGEASDLRVEALALEQAEAVAVLLTERAERVLRLHLACHSVWQAECMRARDAPANAH